MNFLGAALQIASIVVSVILVLLILLQVKGGANMFGGDAGGGLARTRRGLEKILFQFTIGLSTAFLAISILSVLFANR